MEEEGEGWCHPEEEEGEAERGGAIVRRKRDRVGPIMVPSWDGAIVSECSLTCSAVSLAVYYLYSKCLYLAVMINSLIILPLLTI